MAKDTKKKTEPKPKVEAAPDPKPSTPHAWTIAQWKKNAGVQRELEILLSHPVMQMALQTVTLTVMPKALPAEITPGVTAELVMLRDSQILHHRTGMGATIRALHNLARPEKEKPKQAQWGEMLPETE
jgi:hypothetical protein